MDDGILDTRSLESRDDLIEEVGVHPHSVGLSIRPIQVGLIDNMPAASLFGENETSGLQL